MLNELQPTVHSNNNYSQFRTCGILHDFACFDITSNKVLRILHIRSAEFFIAIRNDLTKSLSQYLVDTRGVCNILLLAVC